VTGEYAQYNVEVEESQRRFDPRIRTTLNLSGENIPDIEALCKYISLSQCKELILCNCDLTLKQLKTLIFFMQEYNVKLDKLDLSNNKISRVKPGTVSPRSGPMECALESTLLFWMAVLLTLMTC